MCHTARSFALVLCAIAIIGITACQGGGVRRTQSIQVSLARVTLQGTLKIFVRHCPRQRLYANVGSILPVAEPIVTGRQTIRGEWEHIFAIPGFQSTTTATTVEVSRGGDLGFTQGTYSATFDLANGTQATERGKWVSQPPAAAAAGRQVRG
jgi:hypothetical protein